MYGQTYGGATSVQSHFKDLAQCPNGVQSTAARNCPGNTIRSTDAGGQVYEFYPEVAVQAKCHFLLKRWYTSQPTTLVKSTCLYSTHMAR